MKDEFQELSITYEQMVWAASKLIKQNKEDKEIALIYETQVPKISFDVKKAVREMRSASTGGQSDSWVD